MLDESSRHILEQYRENMPIYNKIRDIVIDKLNKIINNLGMLVNSIDSRIKTEKSLIGKLELKGYKYKDICDITDIVGCRIVTFYSDEIDKIASQIEGCFKIDWSKSVDKRRLLSVDQFGYMSLHFICTIPKEIFFDKNITLINELPFEIQIRTVLQHAWATIEHDMGYKSDIEIPHEYLRGLNRLAGILELADDEFKRLRISIDDYRKKVKTVVNSGNFNDMELNGDTYNAYLEFGAFDKLNKRIAEINNMDIVPVSLVRFLKVFKLFQFSTLGDIEKMINDYSESAYQFALVQFGGKDIDIIASNVGVTCLCVVFILSKGLGEVGLEMFYKTLNGDRKSNEIIIKRAMEIGKKIGLIG